MTEGPCVNFVMREALFVIYMWILCLSYLHEKQTSRIQSLYLYFIKIVPFGYEISVFKYTTGRYTEQPPEQPAHTSRNYDSSWKNGYQNFSYVHRSRKHLECKYITLQVYPPPSQYKGITKLHGSTLMSKAHLESCHREPICNIIKFLR